MAVSSLSLQPCVTEGILTRAGVAGAAERDGVPVVDAAVLLRGLYILFAQVWQALLSVRSLVLPPSQDVHTYLKFSSLCRKSGRVRCAHMEMVAVEPAHTAVQDGMCCARHDNVSVQWQHAVPQRLLH